MMHLKKLFDLYQIFELPRCVYVLYSPKTDKYYVGFTENTTHRIEQDNSGISTFTSRGIPWELVNVFETETVDFTLPQG